MLPDDDKRMLSKHVGVVKSVLKSDFKINDIQLVHLLLV